jgi:sugar phosphate isomerase/epimerase
VSDLRFGVSTHLFHEQRLDREHLVEIAAHGFDGIELFATKSHFDYHDEGAVRQLAEWLDDTRLTLNSLHAPICGGFSNGAPSEMFSNAALDDSMRRKALAEAQAALSLAATIPYRYLVVHLGVPDSAEARKNDNSREAARRSVEEMNVMAGRVGVKLAIEVIPNPLSSAESLVSFIEDDLEGARVGICMDVGHAFMMGDLGDAIETCSGLLIATHLHDNNGKSDDHLAPGQGAIDWPSALMSLQKVGYDGTWLFEVANTSTPRDVLKRIEKARQRFESLLALSFETGAQGA